MKTDEGGTCFVDSFNFMLANPEWTLVHGLCRGQGEIDGVIMAHGWCEKDNIVHDAVTGVTLPKALYYSIGEIETTVKYTHDEAVEMALETELYGCWDKFLIENGETV